MIRQPVRVLHVTTGMGQGGAEMMLSRLILRSDPSVCEHHLLALSDEGPPWHQTRGAAASALNLRLDAPNSALAKVLRIGRFVRACAPNVIQGWMYHGNFFAAEMRRMYAKQAALSLGIHQCLTDLRSERPITRWMIRRGAKISRRAERVLYASHASRDQHTSFGYSADNSMVIPNGFDAAEFRPDAERRAATRLQIGIAESDFVVGIVARHHPIKDHATFIAAAARFASHHPDVRILIAGPGCTSDNRELKQQLAELGGGTKFELLGTWTGVQTLYPALDVFCLTSRSEAFPNVIGEAMACAVICVATDVGDIPLMVGDGGFLAPVGNVEAIAERLEYIKRMNVNDRLRMGARARQLIQARFGIDTVAAQYANLYVDLSDGNSSMAAGG